jgi:thymidine kinase
MYCGKTTDLLRQLNIFGEMNMKVLYVNHTIDSRASTSFSTHNAMISALGKISHSVKVSDLLGSLESIREYEVIGIDEAQFFPDLKEAVLQLVEKYNKIVIVAGLNGDYMRQPFGQIIDLIPYSDEVVKLKPFCSPCAENNRRMRDAHFTKRIVKEAGQVLIGGHDQYIPVCRECYHL